MTNANEHNVRELTLFAENTAELHKRVIIPVIDNLARKVKRRQYDREKALQAWYNVSVEAAKMYAREHATASDWYRIFSVADRKACAAELRDSYRDDIIETARELIGPAVVTVELHDWSRDVCGNPTAHATVLGNGVAYTTRRKRRVDVGYTDYASEGGERALEKAGISPVFYECSRDMRINRSGYTSAEFTRCKFETTI